MYIYMYAAPVQRNMCKSRMHENFLPIDKNTTQKDEKRWELWICAKIHIHPALHECWYKFISVCVCVHVHVCIYCACVCTGEIRCRRRRRCSFVFSVLSDDCWRPWQQLTDLANAKANCGACCSVLVVNRWNTHRRTHTLAYIHTIVRSFVCVCKCITHMNKIYTLQTEM